MYVLYIYMYYIYRYVYVLNKSNKGGSQEKSRMKKPKTFPRSLLLALHQLASFNLHSSVLLLDICFSYIYMCM